jgi:phosphoribosylamine-glycine ligase
MGRPVRANDLWRTRKLSHATGVLCWPRDDDPTVSVHPALDPRHIHFGEVGLDQAGQLVTSGLYGWTLVVTGEGETIAAAQAEAYGCAARVTIPNARYRLDIGDRLIAGDYARLERLGLLGFSQNEGSRPA